MGGPNQVLRLPGSKMGQQGWEGYQAKNNNNHPNHAWQAHSHNGEEQNQGMYSTQEGETTTQDTSATTFGSEQLKGQGEQLVG